MSGWARRSPRLVLASAAAASLALAGCSAASEQKSAAGPSEHPGHEQTIHSSPPTPAQPPAVPASLTSNVKPAATDVPVDTAVRVAASHGRLESVVIRGDDGGALDGTYNATKTTWTAAELLDPGVHYTVQSLAINADGKLTRSTHTFTSRDLTLDQQTYPSLTPIDGETMGIAMPVVVTFDVPVTDRAEFEAHMSVTSTPAQLGSWHWVSSTEVHWRPKTYWHAGTDVSVDLALNGVNAGNGIYGQVDRHIDFSIGKAVLIRVDVSTFRMRVLVDGKIARNVPITGGKPGFETRVGTKVISEKYRSKRMNSATVGIDPNGPNGYNIAHVQYAMRVTNSGEMLHAAPWSTRAQGHYNISHACIGMSVKNARWLYELTPIGTPVEVTGSHRRIEPNNGWTDWEQSWKQYQAGSALS